MTKNVVATTWIRTTDPDGWSYSGPPADTTPPTAPVLAPLSSIASDGFVVRVLTASVDAQSGLRDYVVSVKDVALNQIVQTQNVAPDVALLGIQVSGLTPSTAYSVTATARDLAPSPNVSAASNAVTATTSAPVANTSWFPNWPIMATTTLVGNFTLNIGDASQRDYCGEKDAIIWQGWFYPSSSRYASRIAALSYLRTNYPNCKLIPYHEANETLKTVTTPGNDPMELVKSLIEGPNGNPNWYARRVNGQQTEALNDPTNKWQCNQATNDAGLNNLGERYDQAFARMIDQTFNQGLSANFLNTYADAIYMDNFEARPPQTYVNNGGTAVSDMDFDQDGVTDVINGYSSASNAGGRMWSEGGSNFKATLESRFNKMVVPNAARWGAPDYGDKRNLPPPLPLSNHPYYGKWAGLILKESCELDWGFVVTSTGYTYKGALGPDYAFRALSIQEKFLGPDSLSRAGRSAVMASAYASDRTVVTDDITYARFHSAVALMMPRCTCHVQSSSKRPIPLDELFLELGSPISSRSMGTLNETTLAFTLRSPDFTSGAAKFWWSRFTKGIVVIRADLPTVGVWPSADAAVACTLPAAGAGKKWQMANASNYVSPITGRAMRNQAPSLNNGADVTTVSLKPFHAAFVRLVAGP